MTVYLHIGASKCGSSAIQTALSTEPVVQRHDGSFIKYAVISLAKKRILLGDDIKKTIGVSGYKVSPDARDCIKFGLRDLRERINDIPGDIVLSSEGWLFQPREWKTILSHIKLEVDVVVYVRPQVPVLNAAWWQWGAWSDRPFDEWMERRLEASLWGERIRRWQNIPWVRRVIVRPVPSDVVPDLYKNVFQAPVPSGAITRSNPSLPEPLLRLLQRNRILRPGPHDSKIDFALLANVPLEDPAPWVLSDQWIQRILERTREDNKRLMSFMDDASATAAKSDNRWWSASAYEDKVAVDPEPQAISPEKLEEMCVLMAKAILRLSNH